MELNDECEWYAGHEYTTIRSLRTQQIVQQQSQWLVFQSQCSQSHVHVGSQRI